jgi:putative aldouronate transport system permease protein
MNLWQGFGYGSIIYLAALSNTDMELYEAVAIDGAGRWKQMIYITLPAIKNISIFALILRMASVLSVSTDKIILMYSPATFETADVLGTYIYRVGLLGGQYGLTAAVGLLNSVIGFTLLIIANHISRRFADFRLF